MKLFVTLLAVLSAGATLGMPPTPQVSHGVSPSYVESRTSMIENVATQNCLVGPWNPSGAQATMRTCEDANGLEDWELTAADGQSGVIETSGGGLCLTRSSGTATQNVFVAKCGDARYSANQKWVRHVLGTINNHPYGWIGPAGGPVRLDGNATDAYTHTPNDGSYQKWIWGSLTKPSR